LTIGKNSGWNGWEQQSSHIILEYSNIAFQDKLRTRSQDGVQGEEERKIHRSEKVHRENEGDTRRGKSSAKEDIKRYEEVC